MAHGDLTPRQKKLAGAGALAIFMAFLLAVGWFVGRPMLRFASQPQRFQAWVDAHGLWGRLVFVGMMILQVVVALIPGEPLEIGAGYAFGAWEGTLLCMVGTMAGSAMVFGLVRRFGMPLAEVFFPAEKIRGLPILRSPRRLKTLVFVVFFIPGTPKDLLTWGAGLTPIGFWDYLWLSALARIPSIVTSTVSGNALGVQDYLLALAAFGVVALLSGAGLLIWRAICRRHDKKEAAAGSASAKEAAGAGAPAAGVSSGDQPAAGTADKALSPAPPGGDGPAKR